MFDFLSGFNKRMQIVAIVDTIVNRKNRKMEIESIFPDKHFENVIFSVMVFIMEKTLSEDNECNLSSIANFIQALLSEYYGQNDINEKSSLIAEYIIKTVLQNEGLPIYYPVMNYETGEFYDLRIKLIDDKVIEKEGEYNINYLLTDQGYDFLFRTKEVDQEITFSVEEFKLRELIKRKNYQKALQQSVNLIQMIRQKKKDILQFLHKVKENIYQVEVARFEELVNSTYDLLSEEYKVLSEIMDMVKLSEKSLQDEFQMSGKVQEDIRKAQNEISLIKNNLATTLFEQRDLIINRQSLSKIYIETIKDSFTYTLEKRFDLEEELINRLEKATVDCIENLWKITNSLMLPSVFKHLNPGLIYEPQGMLKFDETEKTNIIEEEEMAEDSEKVRIDKINLIYIEIIENIIRETIKNDGLIKFEDLIKVLKKNEEAFARMMFEHLLFTTILKLYDIGIIDIEKWIESDEDVLVNSTEEFNIEYCLTKIKEVSPSIYGISKLKVFKKDEFENIPNLSGDEVSQNDQSSNDHSKNYLGKNDNLQNGTDMFEAILIHSNNKERIEEKIFVTNFIIQIEMT